MAEGESGRERPFSLASGRFRAEIDFDIAVRGYRRHQVDLYLIGVHHELADVTGRAEHAEQRLADRESELAQLRVELARREPPDPATAPPSNWLGWRLEQVLSMAEEEAEQIRAQARREREQVHRYAEIVHDRLAAVVAAIDRLSAERAEPVPDESTHPKAA
jgi:cell division septum initiation protein DivIVA